MFQNLKVPFLMCLALLGTSVLRGGDLPGRANAPAEGMVLIPASVYHPAFRSPTDPTNVTLKSFYLDVFPVTNGDFLEFVRANPEWRRSRVKRIFADEQYLSHWAGDLDLGPNAETVKRQPVTRISWFAARAYARWKDKRLPTVAEWECAAAASATAPDGSKDAQFKDRILQWYVTPNAATLPQVGQDQSNYWGLHNLHNLVWEWVSDFNTAMVTGDSRSDPGLDRKLFCASGAQSAADRENYPVFMRFAFRSSLKASYTVGNLGFRCAKDYEN